MHFFFLITFLFFLLTKHICPNSSVYFMKGVNKSYSKPTVRLAKLYW